MTPTPVITGLLPPPLRWRTIAPILILSIWLCLISATAAGSSPTPSSTRPIPFAVEIGRKEGALAGRGTLVPIQLAAGAARLGGFSFLVAFDSTVLTLRTVMPGAWLTAQGWETFTYERVPQSERESIYPLSLLRITAAAGPGAQSLPRTVDTTVELARMFYSITDNPQVNCHFLPLQFLWRTCDDNLVYEEPGASPRYVRRVYENVPTAGQGAFDYRGADSLPTDSRDLPPPCSPLANSARDYAVSYVNGGVAVACADRMGNRPGTTDEAAFDDTLPRLDILQLADMILREAVVNASRRNIYGGTLSYAPDGTPLTLGSLVRRGSPPPADSLLGLPPQGGLALLTIPSHPDTARVFCHSTIPLGGLLIIFDVIGQTSTPILAHGLSHMAMRAQVENQSVRLIIFGFEGSLLSPGIHLLTNIPHRGNLRLRSAAAVDKFGRPVKVVYMGH